MKPGRMEYEKPKFPKRDKYTHWWNDEPIADLQEALYFLKQENSSVEPHHLRRNEESGAWELVYEWARDGSSGGASSGHEYYQIDQALAERLVREEFVEPHRDKHWGGSTLHRNKLVLSERGRRASSAFESEMRQKAKSLLIPGKHTDLAGETRYAMLRREHRSYGALYVEFGAPNDEVCLVYPETGRVKF